MIPVMATRILDTARPRRRHGTGTIREPERPAGHAAGLYCTKLVDHEAGIVPATHMLLIGDSDGVWQARGRCDDHPAEQDVMIIRLCWPDQPWLIIDLAGGQAQDAPPAPSICDRGAERAQPDPAAGERGQDHPT